MNAAAHGHAVQHYLEIFESLWFNQQSVLY